MFPLKEYVKDFAQHVDDTYSARCVAYPTNHVNDYPPTHLLHNSHNISYMLIMIFRKSGLTRLLSCLLSILSGYTSCYTILKPSFNPLMFCFQSFDLRNAPRTPHQAPNGTSPPDIGATRRHVVDLLRQWFGPERLCQCHVHSVE